MRVLFLTPHYPPDVASTGQLIAELVEDVAAAGHGALVLTAAPSYTHGRGAGTPQDAGVWKRAWQPWSHERSGNVQVVRFNLPAWGRRGVWTRLLPFAAYAGAAGALAPILRDVDVVYAMSTPPLLSGFIAAVSGALRRRPFVYNLQDIYPDVAVALGVLGSGSLTSAIRSAESTLRHRATAVTVLGEDMRANVLARDASLKGKVEVVPNWVDTKLVRPVDKAQNLFCRDHGLGARFVVLYSGNLGRVHGAEMLPEVALNLADLPDILLLVVGDGPARLGAQQRIDELRLGNVQFLPYQPRGRLAETLSSADVSLVLQRQETCGLVVPSKLYGIMASGRPTVAAVPERSEVARVVTEFDAGIVVPPGHSGLIADAVRKLYLDRTQGRRMGGRARSAACKYFSRRALTRKYVELFEAAAGQGV